MKLRTGLPEEAGMSSERVDRIHQLAASMVEDHITPAEVYLVARKGIIVAHRSYGKLTPYDDSIALPIDALFPICSITKTITATCIMILVDQGLIGLNRPVCDYIPEFSGQGKEGVRIHHLLTHTSGLNGNEITTKPGEKMSYSGYGYNLLGEIIQRISNRSYTDFVKEHVFDALGMKDSYFNVPLSERHRIVKRSPQDPCAEWLETEDFINSTSPSGGMYSTAYDLAIYNGND
jgi:serine-type D-Ala-D-Ala carboxypeptidase